MDSPDCLDTTLTLNGWATEEEVAGFGDTEKKSRAVESLHLFLNPDIHSLPDLGKREMVSDQGGLCGLAALYHALVNTIATASMLRQLDYDTMRELIASEINIKRGDLPGYIDSALLSEFHECKTIRLSMVNVKNNVMHLHVCPFSCLCLKKQEEEEHPAIIGFMG